MMNKLEREEQLTKETLVGTFVHGGLRNHPQYDHEMMCET